MNFGYRFQKFMEGRYGPDELYKFLFYCYLVIFIINLFINFLPLSIIEILIVFIMFYRFFSKNITRRRKENQKFLEIKKKFRLRKRSKKENDYIYKKCLRCKTNLRLPRPYKRGIKHVKCPKCAKRNRVFIFRRQKVDIIK